MANPLLLLEGVSFTYRDTTDLALQDLNFRVEAGEMIAVMGRTGAGKTTLAKILNRTIPSFQGGVLSGEIRFQGELWDTETVSDVAAHIGLVSQDFEAQLFATNVAQEVAFGMEQSGVPREVMRRRVAECLDQVGLEGFDRRDPATLSGGEKQRLAIAAVLALEPKLLVFDEPTTDLDPQGKVEIFRVLANLRRRGCAIVLFEHEIAAAEMADRLVLMGDGRIVADEVPAVLLRKIDVLARWGVRPADLDMIANRLGHPGRFAAVEDGAAALAILRRTSSEPELMLRRAQHERHEAYGMEITSRRTSVLQVTDISFEYEPGRRALDDVSLEIATGDFVAIIGPNGSGKTTLARHLNGILTPAAGNVLLDGQIIRGKSLQEIATTVGYCFQNPDHQIFSESVFDEVAFGLRNRGFNDERVRSEVAEALSAVGLEEQGDADPFLLGKGQRRRLAVASILALRPRVLILDEPTTGLDHDEMRQMMELVARLHRDGMTIIIITHTPWIVAEYARRGVLMRAGRVVLDAPIDTFLAQEELLQSCQFAVPDVVRLGALRGRFARSVDALFEVEK